MKAIGFVDMTSSVCITNAITPPKEILFPCHDEILYTAKISM